MILQHVGHLLTECVKALARDWQWSINDVLLHALRNGLGISAAQQFSETRRDLQAPMLPGGHWEDAELGAFEEALRALKQARATQLAPESIRGMESLAGAE